MCVASRTGYNLQISVLGSRIECRLFNFDACSDIASIIVSTRVYFSSRAEYVLFESVLPRSAAKVNLLNLVVLFCLDLLSARLIRATINPRQIVLSNIGDWPP